MSHHDHSRLEPKKLYALTTFLFGLVGFLGVLLLAVWPHIKAFFEGAPGSQKESWGMIIAVSIACIGFFLYWTYIIYVQTSTQIDEEALSQRRFWKKAEIQWRDVATVEEGSFVIIVKSENEEIRIAPQAFHNSDNVINKILERLQSRARPLSSPKHGTQS